LMMQGWGGCRLRHAQDARLEMAGSGGLEGVQARRCRAGEGVGSGMLEMPGSRWQAQAGLRECGLNNAGLGRVQAWAGLRLRAQDSAGSMMCGAGEGACLGMLKRVWA